MKKLTRQDFSPWSGCRTKDIAIAGMEGEVRLRQLTALESASMISAARDVADDDQDANMRFNAMFIGAMMIDADTGERIFPEGSEDQILACIPRSTFNALFRECMDLNGMTQAAMERIEKNSETTTGGDGGSGSPGCADIPTRITCSGS